MQKKIMQIILLISIITTTIAYSGLSTNLAITSEASFRSISDIRITNIELQKSNDGAIEQYKSMYTKDTTTTGIKLPNANSKITYKITVENRGEVDQTIYKILTESTNDINVKYEISEYNEKEIINFNSTKTFLITFFTNNPSENIINIKLKYDFRKVYKIEYDANGGEKSPQTQIKYEKEDLKLAEEEPIKEGYTFKGWTDKKEENTIKYTKGSTYTLDKDIILYAVWQQEQYTVTFDANKGSVNPSNTKVTYNSKYGTLPTPTREGYTFDGWYHKNLFSNQLVSGCNNCKFENGIVTQEKADIGSTLSWKLQKLNNGSFVGNINSDLVKTEGIVHFTFTKDSSFDAIIIGLNGSKYDTKVYIDLKNFENKTYTISLEIINAIQGSISWRNIQIESGNIPTNYEPSIFTESTKVEIASDHTLYARWIPNTYTITFNNDGKIMDSESKIVTYDSAYGTLPVLTKVGYTFKGWFTESDGGVNITSSSKVEITSNQTLYAHFTINNYTLTIKPNGGIFNGSTSDVTYTQNYNTLKILKKPTREGYTFNGWEISGIGAMIKGNSLFSDEIFANGINGFYVYNNSGGGTVTHTRVAKTSDDPFTDTSYMMRIKTTGSASPGLGGYYQATASKANGIFYHVIVAKIPVGYKINQANNSVGEGGTFTWLTPILGTGEFETYIYRANNGSSGTFSTFGHVYITGNPATQTNPVTWDVAYSNMFDATNSINSEDISQLFTYGAGNATLTAKWKPNTYQVTFNANGGSVSPSNKTVTYNSTYGALPTPTRTNYIFDGWSNDMFDDQSILSKISGYKYENNYHVFSVSAAYSKYGSGIEGLTFKQNTQYILKIKGHTIYSTSSTSNFRIVFRYTDGSSSYGSMLNYTTDTEISYASEKNKTIQNIFMYYGNGGTAYISYIHLEEGDIANINNITDKSPINKNYDHNLYAKWTEAVAKNVTGSTTTYYTSLNSALNNASTTTSTITTLLKNTNETISITKSLKNETLDLNQKTLIGVLINNNQASNITIKNGTITNTSDRVIYNTGIMNIESGTYAGTYTGFDEIIYNTNGAKLTLKDGRISTEAYSAITNDGEFIMEGGMITSSSKSNRAVRNVNSNSWTYIYGGTIYAENGYGVYNEGNNSTSIVRIGNPSASLNTTIPSVYGKDYGVVSMNGGSLGFYNGTISGGVAWYYGTINDFRSGATLVGSNTSAHFQ